VRALPILFCLFAAPALACDYCERQITLNADLSACYLAKVEAEIVQMEQSGLPAQLINLATCGSAETATRGGGSLPGAVPGMAEPTLSFVLDAPALRCLARELEAEGWNPDVLKTFEVRRDCETQ